MNFVKSAALALAACLAMPYIALADEGPAKLDIAIVWGLDNCEALDVSDDLINAAKDATAGLSAEENAASEKAIDEIIETAFEGDIAEYCLFISEMAEGL